MIPAGSPVADMALCEQPKIPSTARPKRQLTAVRDQQAEPEAR